MATTETAPLKGATLFSGIGAPECAAPFIDWRWCAEIEAFPSRVLAARFGHANLGDVSADDFCERAAHAGRPDVLVFGSPCQSFSVAGKRLGLDDPRGNLALRSLAIAGQLRPRWLVFENVPGLLSSDSGRDFGTFLGTLGQLGYGWAYRVLDAQYFGVPQRRRRLFLVGHSSGAWQRAAAVLFERESLSGHPPPRREAGQDPAGTLGGSSQGGGFRTTDLDNSGAFVPEIVGQAMTAKWQKGASGPAGDEHHNLVAHALRGEGFDASEDGTGRGTPLVPIAFDCKASAARGISAGDVAPTLRGLGHDKSHANGGGQLAIAIQERAVSENPDAGPDGAGFREDLAYTLEARSSVQSVAFDLRGRDGGAVPEGPHDTANIRAAGGGSSRSYVADEWAVRRLTPLECERLQGFPDGWTDVASPKGKPAADGPRYKVLGNSMAVPVLRWLLDRVKRVDGIDL